jgi:serine/threonine protein kinase
MADVYLALKSDRAIFNQLVALKVLRIAELQENPELVQMFQSESRLAALLNHPNIVHSHDVGDEEGIYYIAMEYLAGQSLSRVNERMRKNGERLPLDMLISVLCQVLDGLEYAHSLTDHLGQSLNLVHRDISPQNIFLTYSGHVKLLDFGIAKTLETNRTVTGVIKGKAPYMSPEQASGKKLDLRSDLFSVGVILWEAVAGRRLHGNLDVCGILRKLSDEEVTPIRAACPTVSVELEAVLSRALAKNPEDRFSSAGEFRRELRAVEHHALIEPYLLGERISSLFTEERNEIARRVKEVLSKQTDDNTDESTRGTLGDLEGEVPFQGAYGIESDLVANEISVETTAPVTRPVPRPAIVRAEPVPPLHRSHEATFVKQLLSRLNARYLGAVVLLGTILVYSVFVRRITPREPSKAPAVANATPVKAPATANVTPVKAPAVANVTPVKAPAVANVTPVKAPAVANVTPVKAPAVANVTPSYELPTNVSVVNNNDVSGKVVPRRSDAELSPSARNVTPTPRVTRPSTLPVNAQKSGKSGKYEIWKKP